MTTTRTRRRSTQPTTMRRLYAESSRGKGWDGSAVRTKQGIAVRTQAYARMHLQVLSGLLRAHATRKKVDTRNLREVQS
eukprot:3006068-Pleurochrysis_carterae.AAC.1